METRFRFSSWNKFFRSILIPLAVVCLISGVILLYYLGRQVTQPKKTTPVTMAQISITDNGFDPATLTVKAGTVVIWSNQTTSAHWVITNLNGDSSLNSGQPIQSNNTYSFTFKKTGTYGYHDNLHPLVNGTVQVLK